jgi:hypothetical protein
MLVFQNYSEQVDAPTISKDPKFQSYKEFEEIDLDAKAFNYLIYPAPNDYHYVIGFNLMRLLDKLKVNYKNELLQTPDKGLHRYLDDYLNP